MQGGYHPQDHPTKTATHVFSNTKLFNGFYRQGLMIGGSPLKHKPLGGGNWFGVWG